jgi:hypothetical protein
MHSMEIYSNENPEPVTPAAGVPTAETRRVIDRRWGWQINWSAILAGTFISMGLFLLFLIFGTALGLTILDPYQISRHENSAAWTGGTIAWLVVSSLAAVFLGSWFAGHIGRYGREGATIQGAVIWGLCALLTAVGLSRSNLFPQRALRPAESKVLSTGYSSLDDPQFAGFILEHAKNWRPGSPETPVNVSVETQQRVNPNKVPNNGDLRRFVESNTTLNSKQAEEFLESDKNAIANAQAEAQKRWEEQNATELARLDRARKAASAAAWTLTAIAFFSLAAAIGGSYLGWYQRDHDVLTRMRHHPPPPRTA